MKSGTKVNEITDSLPNGDIIRIFGSGWQPRSRSLEIITSKNGSTKIDDYTSLKELSKMLINFLKNEKGKV